MNISWSMPGRLHQHDLVVSPSSTPIEIQHQMELALKAFRNDLMQVVYAQVRGAEIADEARN